jgi:hypothetical protein
LQKEQIAERTRTMTSQTPYIVYPTVQREQTVAPVAEDNLSNISTSKKAAFRPFIHDLIIKLIPRNELPTKEKHKKGFLQKSRDLTMQYYPMDEDRDQVVKDNTAKIAKYASEYPRNASSRIKGTRQVGFCARVCF